MKILIIHSVEGDAGKIARGLGEGSRKNGHQVDVINTKESRNINFFPYDLIIVGSPTIGFFKGKIAKDLSPFLGQCKRTVGKDAIAYVSPRAFATTKALKALMGELEKLGCVVKNFTSLKSYNDGLEFGTNLRR
ncbi:MAG TPA: DNA-binding response regulator [Halanaerobiales bacterium]|nr:DNA-binding response regulator [Halanaerobiales bacterium]